MRLHVFISRMSEGYEWREVASLGVSALETDRWIGNACLTSDEHSLAVVYAPRTFTNDEALFAGGAFAALIDVESGEVTPLSGGYTLSYSNPGCGIDDNVVLSQFTPDGSTHIIEFSAQTPEQRDTFTVPQMVTSLTVTSIGLVGALGSSVVQITGDNQTHTIQDAGGLVFDISATEDGGMAYLQHDGTTSHAMLISALDSANVAAPVELASGRLDQLGLARDALGGVYLTGEPDEVSANLPPGVHVPQGIQPRSPISSRGNLFLQSTDMLANPRGVENSTGDTASVKIAGVVTTTDTDVEFTVAPAQPFTPVDAKPLPTPDDPPITPRSGSSSSTENAHDPISSDGVCAIPRNDPAIQAYQPRPAEVEWAVDRGVQQTIAKDFPLLALNGGGRVPAQVMLGILAQESNFWQASRYTVPGVTGDPLIANYYGMDSSNEAEDAWWQINYNNADCGYGIAQVTDGMRTGEMSYALQRLIATDYQANIARGLQILVGKWNQTRAAGLIINDGDPQFIENWFYALWAYNSGFYERNAVNPGEPWGVGWSNNPINSQYPANRHSFLDNSPQDAAHPQDWPYPEKVLGFAANSVELLDSVDQGPLGDTFNYEIAFTPSWWAASDNADGTLNRSNVRPPIDLFCNDTNECNPLSPAAPCTRSDDKCWFHVPAMWKDDCSGKCGYEYLTYALPKPKPAAANSYPPNCSKTGLPPGALIVDDLPNGTKPIRSDCTAVATSGSFQFTFADDTAHKFPAKIDLHQLGSGFNGHFYFSHTRVPGSTEAFTGALDITGTWTLGQPLHSWAQVYVHMPSHGAWLQQASYTIDTGLKQVTRSVNQQNYANVWVSLGTLEFSGTPSITLSNNTARYSEQPLADALSGEDDIAWDAVAFVPLQQKPSDFIVALGDSYSSGEGTSPHDGSGFLRGSDHDGIDQADTTDHDKDPIHRNACHRSLNAWPYGIDPPGIPGTDTARILAGAFDPRLDFQLLACSGATTNNILPSTDSSAKQQYGELTQLDRGFLDENTTLVTLTIGGNDLGFAPIIRGCLMHDALLQITEAIAGGLIEELASTSSCIDEPASQDVFSGTLGEMAQEHLSTLAGYVTSVLQEVHSRAPNARVLLLGYPSLFEQPTPCMHINTASRGWLNSVTDQLNSELTKAALFAGSYVTYQNPQYLFHGRNLCSPNAAINDLVFWLTPGDKPLSIPTPLGLTLDLRVMSAQTAHPNTAGAKLYSDVANFALSSSRFYLQGTLVGGVTTTYYDTFRLHDGGPISLNISAFSQCGQEIRVGLRRDDVQRSGVYGEQDTASLSWTQPNGMQTFTWIDSPEDTPLLPSGYYAVNARLTTACPGGASQPWSGQLFLQ